MISRRRIRALRAVGDGTSRRHCRYPAIGNKPAGWEGSPGNRVRSVQATPTAMLRSPGQSSPIRAGAAAQLLLIPVYLPRPVNRGYKRP